MWPLSTEDSTKVYSCSSCGAQMEPGRRAGYCKACHRGYHSAYRHSEKRRGYVESYKERANELRRTQYIPGGSSERNKLWRQENPDKERAAVLRRRATERGAIGCITHTEILEMYSDQNGNCAYCERELDGVYEVDHMIPLSRGGRGDWTNIAVVCRSCNRRKNALTVEEFWPRLLNEGAQWRTA